jgi:hypothetical protein
MNSEVTTGTVCLNVYHTHRTNELNTPYLHFEAQVYRNFCNHLRYYRRRDSSVSIATGYGLDDQGGGSSSPERVKNFLHIVQTGSGVHPTSYKMGTGGSFPGIKRQGREADHSLPTSAEVKKMWITSTPPYVFMA